MHTFHYMHDNYYFLSIQKQYFISILHNKHFDCIYMCLYHTVTTCQVYIANISKLDGSSLFSHINIFFFGTFLM